MNKAVIFILVFSLLSLSIPQNFILAETTNIVIETDSLNVRSGAGLSFQVVAGVKRDEKFEVIETNGDWVKIKLSNSLSGWVASWLVSFQDNDKKQETVVIEPKPVIMETTAVDGLRVRNGPGTSFQVIGSVNKGEPLQFIEKSENWIKISFKQQEGWVHSDYLTGIPSMTDSEKTGKQKSGIVHVGSLNVRDLPSLNGAIIGKISKDETVEIYSENNDWYGIRFNNGNGWVHKDFVTIGSQLEQGDGNDSISDTEPDPTPIKNNPPNQVATVTATLLNVRSDSSLNGNVLFQVKKGDQVEVILEQNNWYKIKLATNGKEGWVAGWYIEKITTPLPPVDDSSPKGLSAVTILYNMTNIRSGPATTHQVILRAKLGESYTIVEKDGDWYKVVLAPDQFGYVAGWIVSTTGGIEKVDRPGMNQYISGKTIVIDPGHGGRDNGSKGIRGNLEKALTLRTAKLLDEKLRAAGAKTVLTRNQDTYVSLNNRVSLAHYYQADAFLSLHYDSTTYPSAKGITTYYYNKTKDYALGQSIQTELIKNTSLRDRGVVYGNYHVLRQNKRPSVLLELGFLSNFSEEANVIRPQYQEQVTTAIYNGLAQVFKK